MKRTVISLFLGVIGFCLTYLALCYLIPGWRIKLDAEPMVYFLASLRSMVLLKTGISGMMGILAMAAFLMWKK